MSERDVVAMYLPEGYDNLTKYDPDLRMSTPYLYITSVYNNEVNNSSHWLAREQNGSPDAQNLFPFFQNGAQAERSKLWQPPLV